MGERFRTDSKINWFWEEGVKIKITYEQGLQNDLIFTPTSLAGNSTFSEKKKINAQILINACSVTSSHKLCTYNLPII